MLTILYNSSAIEPCALVRTERVGRLLPKRETEGDCRPPAVRFADRFPFGAAPMPVIEIRGYLICPRGLAQWIGTTQCTLEGKRRAFTDPMEQRLRKRKLGDGWETAGIVSSHFETAVGVETSRIQGPALH
jgi:hypothetical protein